MSTPTTPTMDPQLLPLLKRVAFRYLPLLFILYVVSIIDRVNVGFAKLQMQEALQFSDTVYGLGAGIFFIGYFLFEVPSNMLLARVGARKWIARILLMWGPIAAATAFVETPLQFYVLRFLLGVGEAGLFPGVVLFITYWFPSERRTRYIAMFMLGMPIAGVIIGPLSAFIMTSMAGLHGLQGWQWMFIVQGMPAFVLGLVVLVWLDDRPSSAKWLSPDEKAQLQRAVGEPLAQHMHPLAEMKMAFKQTGIWIPTLCYFFLVSVAAVFGLWGPQFLQDVLQTNLKGVGGALAGIFFLGTVGMVVAGALSDNAGRRDRVLLFVMGLSSFGFIVATLGVAHPAVVILGFGMGVFGYLAAFPVFWGSITARLAPVAAAATIAMINSIGNLGGAIGPALVGPIKQHHGLSAALATLAAFALAMFITALIANMLRKK